MTSEHFRRMALALPETEECAHQGHPDFRVRGKIFATLAYPDESFAMVKVNPRPTGGVSCLRTEHIHRR